MAINKADFDTINERLKKITEQSVEQIEVNSDLPPTIEQLEDNNKTYSIMAAILFIDIRKSTHLTESSQAKSMVKIYRAFMRMAVDCVRKNSGVTRQFLGDRIMGVFIDSKDENGTITEKAVDKAVNAARSLQTVIDFSLNKHLKNNVNGKMIECGIGIDFGKVLVTQVGMYGVESDDNKENETDCVWVGSTTNYASKYSDIAFGGEIFISDSVYKNLSDDYKEVWVKSAKYKGTKLFQGYVTNDYYLDFTEQLGNPIKIEEDSTVERDTSKHLADGIKEIEVLQNKLIQRERELAVLEAKLKKENQELISKLKNENTAKLRELDEREKVEKERDNLVSKAYSFVKAIISGSFCCEYEYIKNLGIKKWLEIDEFYHLLGSMKDYDEDCINCNAFEFIEIYSYFDNLELSYKYMVSMAKNNYTWIYINEKTFKWACKENQGWQVINAMENNLKNNKIPYDKIKDYEKYIERLKKIRGF